MNNSNGERCDETLIHIRTIANRLWSHRAAILVGAGFSKNADKNYPDWRGLADIIWDRLHPCGSKIDENKNYVDVMQLAEEYVATFGRPSLDALIRKSCYHPEVAPSQLHKDLLSLPWTDVFTTNYDTLLEKAASDVRGIKYGYVLAKEDLAYVEKPRIIKLHGSFPSTHPFVLTARDYRQYIYDHSPFVNTVQQSLLENTFCLLGFSGDDPNFLKWLEWVRHNLGEKNVQKVYLLSVCDLSSSQRELLKDRGIIPIDLRTLETGRVDAKTAISSFLNRLKSSGDNKVAWPNLQRRFEALGVSDVDVGMLGEFTEYLDNLRNSSPDWLVLPETERQALHFGLSGWLYLKQEDLSRLKGDKRHKLLTGLVWLSQVSRISLPLALLQEVQRLFCDLCGKANRRNKWEIDFRTIALALLRSFRERGEYDKWQETWDEVQSHKTEYGVTFVDELKYEECLCSLYRLSLEKCTSLVESWKPEISSSIACVRKVGLLVDLGEFEVAMRLAEASLNWLRSAHSVYDSQKDLRFASAESSLMITIRRIERYLSNKQEIKSFQSLDNKDVDKCADDIQNVSDDAKRGNEEEQARQKERQDEEAQSEKKFFDRHYELKKIKCDMTDELRGYTIALGEVQRRGSSSHCRRWMFDIHDQRLSRTFRNTHFDMMIATSFFRFIEDSGLTIRVGHGYYIDKDLLACSIESIWEASPSLAFSTLALYGCVDTIQRVLDRTRLLCVGREYAERCVSDLLSALNAAVERRAIVEGAWGTLCENAPEIISRLISKCGIEKRLEVARFIKMAYSRDVARRWLDLDNLIRRLFCGASPVELKMIALEILPDESIRCMSPWERMHFQHPFTYIDFERICEDGVSNNHSIQSMSFTRLRKQLQSRERFEYEWALDTLRVLLHLGCLSEKQKIELGDVIGHRMTSAFSIGRGSYYLLLLYGEGGSEIVEKFKNRMLRKILHPFDEIEGCGISNIRVRRQVRDMQVMLKDLIKVSAFIPETLDREFAWKLSCKLLEWLDGSEKWVADIIEKGPRSGLTFLTLLSDVMSDVVIANLSIDECLKICVHNDALYKRDIFVRWRLAVQLKTKKTEYGGFKEWALSTLKDMRNNNSWLAINVLHDIAVAIPDVAEEIILELVEIVRIRGYWNSINILRRLVGFIGDENITKTDVVLKQLLSMLGEIREIGQYESSYTNAMPIEQCMSLRACAVRIACLLSKKQQIITIDVHGFVEYWLSVSTDENEFAEVRIGA